MIISPAFKGFSKFFYFFGVEVFDNVSKIDSSYVFEIGEVMIICLEEGDFGVFIKYFEFVELILGDSDSVFGIVDGGDVGIKEQREIEREVGVATGEIDDMVSSF